MARIVDKALVAQKIGMSRIIDADGKVIPVTLLKVSSQKVTKILTTERDGYNGYQVGFFEKAEKNLGKADIARLRKCSVKENFARFKEFRTAGLLEGVELGHQITAALFEGVEHVDVTGMTKGRGFQGAIKRWGSSISRMTHGSCYHRRPGSLGSNTSPGRVFKNKKQPGHMGDETTTMRNLKVVEIDVENNVIALKGSVPGYRRSFLEIRPTNKG